MPLLVPGVRLLNPKEENFLLPRKTVVYYFCGVLATVNFDFVARAHGDEIMKLLAPAMIFLASAVAFLLLQQPTKHQSRGGGVWTGSTSELEILLKTAASPWPLEKSILVLWQACAECSVIQPGSLTTTRDGVDVRVLTSDQSVFDFCRKEGIPVKQLKSGREFPTYPEPGIYGFSSGKLIYRESDEEVFRSLEERLRHAANSIH